MAPIVELRDVEKQYGQTRALERISLEVNKGEFFTLLGPSGCGKTTTLRSIAGFVVPTSGDVLINGSLVNDVPPHRRRVGMVFQNYALFPHRTVFQNVAFGLRMQRMPRAEIAAQVAWILGLVQLSDYGDRYPRQLSGGQQQRVALARALVTRPAVLLLDEPLGALDKKLRDRMKLELRRLQLEIGITSIYVTHDQEEALTMSDRIAVMNAGRVEQVGNPLEIYEQPKSLFVADFIGDTNLLDCQAVATNRVVCKGQTMRVEGLDLAAGEAVKLAIRPEKLRVDLPMPLDNTVNATVSHVIYQGNTSRYLLRSPEGIEVVAVELARVRFRSGDQVRVTWAVADARVLRG